MAITPSETFTRFHNDIEEKLQEITNSDKRTNFYELIDKATNLKNPVIARYGSELKELHKLRNIIEHDKSNCHPDIALPTEYAINRISKIANLLIDPLKVIPLFQKQVFTLQYNDFIYRAVKNMHEKDYSQIPIYNQKDYIGLITTNTIARWLGAEEICDSSETLISYVYDKYTEDKNNYIFISKDSTLFKALGGFYEFQNKGKRLEAVLITESAKEKESLLGIITIYDLPLIYEKLE